MTRRFQDLRRVRADAAEADLLSQDRRHRRAPLRHGRAPRLHLDRDERIRRQHPRHLRSARPATAAGGLALVDAGQHVEGDETPSWPGRRHRLHHALRFGDEMWASCWHAGFWVVDVSDLARPKTAGAYNYHPLFPEPTHTVMPVPDRIGGRRIAVAIDEEDQALSASEEEARRGRAHACLLTFDVSDLGAIKPLGQFQMSELDSPFSRTSGARFGAHQFCERMAGTVVYAVWFGGGLRIIDVADPLGPREIGHFIPQPAAGRSAPQSNDAALDERGLIYMVDRHVGFDVLEYEGSR